LTSTIDSAADRTARAPSAIVVAAHNEAERIGATLAALAEVFAGVPVWLADDGSTDGTAVSAASAGARVVRSERMIGKGAAMSAAAREALAALAAPPGDGALAAGQASAGGAERAVIVVLCDGDLGASAAALDALTGPIADASADVTIARFATRVGGGLGLARGFARWAIRRRCGLETTAPISGQRALSARALSDVLPFADGYGMEIGITIDAVRAGHRVLELELELSHRASGRTLAGFAHRGRQLVDFVRVYLARA
jgi:glycosyltransferase involved in cell wall biosynthesis